MLNSSSSNSQHCDIQAPLMDVTDILFFSSPFWYQPLTFSLQSDAWCHILELKKRKVWGRFGKQ